MTPALENAVAATLTDNTFFADLALAVTNDGSRDGAAAWLVRFAESYLLQRGQQVGAIAAYDFAAVDWERLVMFWPLFRRAAELSPIPADHILPALARFMVERMPVVWSGPALTRMDPVTFASNIADRVDTLVTMFAGGLKPNGSKDPYALRRAAKQVLQMIMFSVTVPPPVGCGREG